MRVLVLPIVFVLLSVLLLQPVLAATIPNASIVSTASQGNFSWAATNTTASQVAGNITHTSFFLNSTTYRWAGLFGNVSGNIVLGDAGSNSIFTWSAEGVLVYASDTQPNWTNVVDANEADVVSRYSFLGENASDRYTETFTGASEDISSSVFSITSDYAPAFSSGGTPWKTYSLSDGVNIIFAGLVKPDGDFNYRGGISDFQMILPEGGHDSSPTTYNLYVELT